MIRTPELRPIAPRAEFPRQTTNLCDLCRRVQPTLGKLILLAAFFSWYAQGAPRDSATALFSQGNAAYQKGDFAAAERPFLEILNQGVESGTLYYNLGNACFKQKRLGEAIYYWEKARQKLPADPEIHENLELANLLVVDRVEVPGDPIPIRWLESLAHRLTIAQDSWMLVVLFMAANGLLTIFLVTKKARVAARALYAAFAAGFLVLVFSSSLLWKIYEKSYRQEGVVIEQKVDVRSGPGTENITVFTVHEGILLRIRGENNGWYQISLPNGWSGWLEKRNVRVL